MKRFLVVFWICAAPLILSTPALSAPHERTYDLVDVSWSVSLDERNASFDGSVTNTISLAHPQEEVVFDCGDLQIKDVKADGKTASYRLDNQKLKVQLPQGAPHVGHIAIQIRYSGKPQAGMYFIRAEHAYPAHTGMVYTQGEMEDNHNWLPTYDFPDNKATSEGFIEVPRGQIAISNGRLVEVTAHGDRRVFHWKMDKPHSTYLISFVAGDYDKGSERWKQLPVDYYVPHGLLDMGKRSFEGTARMIAQYSELTGFEYPYAKFAQDTVADFMFGGMENVTAVTQTIQTLHPEAAEPIENSAGLVAHELAHQWFGDTVTCADWSHAWLNEGFASFMPAFLDRTSRGAEAFDLDRYGAFAGGLAAHDSDKRPVVWTGYKDPIDMFNGFAYSGGASRLFMLMHELGERTFWNGVRDYLQEHKYEPVTTDQFFASMSRSAHKDLTGFKQQWLYTPAAPHLTLTLDDTRLVIRQSEPAFDMMLPVWVLDGKSWTKLSVHLTGRENTLDLGQLSMKPVLVDPECWLMANIDSRLPMDADDLLAVYSAAPNSAEKARMIDTMLAKFSPDQWLELANLESSPRLLPEIVPHLRDEKLLLQLASHADAHVRNSVAERLGFLKSSNNTLEVLRSMFANDPNIVVQRTALSSLLRLTGDSALAAKAWRTDSFRDSFRQLALNWWSKHNPALARERCLEVLDRPSTEPLRVDAIEQLGALGEEPGATNVFDHLAAVVQEYSFRARVAAIQSLAKLGNKSAIPLLEPLTHHPLVLLRTAAQRALKSLGAPSPGAVPAQG